MKFEGDVLYEEKRNFFSSKILAITLIFFIALDVIFVYLLLFITLDSVSVWVVAIILIGVGILLPLFLCSLFG